MKLPKKLLEKFPENSLEKFLDISLGELLKVSKGLAKVAESLEKIMQEVLEGIDG